MLFYASLRAYLGKGSSQVTVWLMFKIGVSKLNFIIHKLGHFSPSTCSLIFMVHRYIFKELWLFVYLSLILLKEKNVKEKSDFQQV